MAFIYIKIGENKKVLNGRGVKPNFNNVITYNQTYQYVYFFSFITFFILSNKDYYSYCNIHSVYQKYHKFNNYWNN